MPPVRILQVCAAAALLLLSAYFLLVPSWPTQASMAQWQKTSIYETPADNATLDLEILTALKLPQKFSYQRHCIRAKETRGLGRERLIQLPQELLSDPEAAGSAFDVDAAVKEGGKSLFPPCDEALTVEVPDFSSHADANTSSLMLGVATTLKRIEDSLPTFSRWLSNSGTPLLVLLVDQTDLEDKRKEVERTKSLAMQLNIEIILEPYHHVFEHDSEGLKNFGLATALDKHRRPETQWFGIIDDDTFFLSLQRMVEALAPYDPEKQWYIGALTEGHTRVSEEGFKAWGGAGFFISPPLMRTLAENAVQCIPLDKFFGDILWRDCIIEVTSPTVPLTEMRGLNQMDLWKDISGWYEAGFNPILTVHHWKSWHFFPIAVSHIVTDVAGPDALLQRYQFGNSTVLTNGYSVVEYPAGLPDLNLVELTMTEDVNVKRPPERLEFHHSMGRTRPALEPGKEKVSWRFKHAVKTADDTVRQFYVKEESNSDISVIEIDWRHA